ncbi:MAG TPA: N-acetylmuramoyl-L-alanine amidase, partial [Bacteroidales bacterium]|nr:N-acetylmuramoyl-L-alanine amidase [Bacteroidales bacterium]
MRVSSCEKNNVWQDKTILIDPGHGGTAATDTFRVGPTGEREEWVNLRVAKYLKELLTDKGATVIMTRNEDIAVGLKERALMARESHADVFLSIHHNATADTSVNFPIVYFHGNASENQASVQLGTCLVKHIKKSLYADNTPVSLVSDHVIFPTSGAAVLRHSYGIPGIIGEASFFTNPTEEERLKDSVYNQSEAQAYFDALQEFFQQPALPITEKYATIKISPFSVLQESNRMNDIARMWQQDFYNGQQLFETEDQESLQKALQLFTRSARSFPDSWLAPAAHDYRY